MKDVTRRGFLKATSMGAAAIGVLGALPMRAFAQSSTPASPATDSTGLVPAPAAPTAGETGLLTTPFVVYVNSPEPGQAVIYVGDQEIPITDGTVVQFLQQAALGTA